MSSATREKNKLPRSVEEIQAIEDRLARIQADFRDIRVGMKDAGMDKVELSLGTFLLFLGKLEQLAKKYKGAFEAQEIKKSVEAVRVRKIAEVAARPQKNSRK